MQWGGAHGQKLRRKRDRNRGWLAAMKYRKEEMQDGAHTTAEGGEPITAAALTLASASAEAAFIETVGEARQGMPGVPFAPLNPEECRDPDKMKGLTLQWLRTLADSEQRFSSATIWAQCVFMQIQRATQDLPSPNLFRTTAACTLLARLCDEMAARQDGMLGDRVKVFQEFKETPHSPMRASYAAPKEKTQYSFGAGYGGGGADSGGLSLSGINLQPGKDEEQDEAASQLSGSLYAPASAVAPSEEDRRTENARVFRSPALGRKGGRGRLPADHVDGPSPGLHARPPSASSRRETRRFIGAASHEQTAAAPNAGSLHALFSALLNDVFAAVYAGWDAEERDVRSWIQRVGGYQEVFASARLFADLKHEEEARTVAARGEMEAGLKAIEDARIRKNGAVLMEVGTWKLTVLKMCFKGWHAETKVDQRINEAIERIVKSKQQTLDVFLKWAAFLKFRVYAAKMKGQRELREHEGQIRKWRDEKSEMQLHGATVQNQLANCSQQHQEAMHTQGMYHRADLEKLQRELDELKATVAERDSTIADLETKLSASESERDKWRHLAGTCAGVDGDQGNVDHPFYPFVTDQPYRARMHRKIVAKKQMLEKECEAYAARAHKTQRQTQDNNSRKAQLEVLERQVTEAGDPENFSFLAEPRSLQEFLQQHQSTDRLLLQFCNYIFDTLDIQRASPLENFSSDMQDSEVFIVLLKVVFPKKCTLDPLLETSHHVRAGLVVDATYRVGLEGVITEDDILLGRAQKNSIFVAMLFKVYSLAVAVGEVGEECLEWTEGMIETRRELQAATAQKEAGSSPRSDADDAALMPVLKFEESTRILFQARRAWQYMGEHVMREVVKQLQGGQRDGDVLDGKWNKTLLKNTALDEGRLLDIIVADVNEDDELEECEDVLGRHYGDIRAVYNYYSCLEAGEAISPSAFTQFAQDAGLTQLVGKKVLEVCRIKATMGGNPNAMTQSELCEFMIRVGFSAFRRSGHSCSRSLTLLLTQHVLPTAMRSNVDGFRRELKSLHCQRVMAAAQPLLKRGFMSYASNVKGADGAHTNVVTLHDYNKFLKDCGVLDSRFTHADASFVFTASLIDAPQKTSNVGLALKEWFECCACIALFKMPSPLMPTAVKLDVFFSRTIFPRLKNKLKPSQAG
eukprot:TRINITY_DN1506_c0_g1_i1.p1 TRINITY_DN1506_c0_g1~~TRINITY_DN1506_c0_g1_i1.p1  ORF type:complete len:1146 (+),score=339.28 TRINITY_DN1506_c0_g1_i1:119-3556(+)